MNASVRGKLSGGHVTHCIADSVFSDKYEVKRSMLSFMLCLCCARTYKANGLTKVFINCVLKISGAFEIPIMKKEWLHEAWRRRDELDFTATSEAMVRVTFVLLVFSSVQNRERSW